MRGRHERCTYAALQAEWLLGTDARVEVVASDAQVVDPEGQPGILEASFEVLRSIVIDVLLKSQPCGWFEQVQTAHVDAESNSVAGLDPHLRVNAGGDGVPANHSVDELVRA